MINLPTEAKVGEIIMDRLILKCKLSKCGDRRAAKGKGHPPGESDGTGDEDVFRAMLLGGTGTVAAPAGSLPGARPAQRGRQTGPGTLDRRPGTRDLGPETWDLRPQDVPEPTVSGLKSQV